MSRANLSGPARRRLRVGWVSIRIEQVVLFVKVAAMETDARAFHSHPARESSGSLVTAHTVRRRRRAGRSVQAAGCGARGTASAISSPGKPPKLPEVGPFFALAPGLT